MIKSKSAEQLAIDRIRSPIPITDWIIWDNSNSQISETELQLNLFKYKVKPMNIHNFREQVYEFMDELESTFNNLVYLMDELEMSGVYEDKCTIQDLIDDFDPFGQFLLLKGEFRELLSSVNKIQVTEDLINYEELYDTTIATE